MYYKRRLPHWHPPGKPLFVTIRLFGSLPEDVVERLRQERDRLKLTPLRPGEHPRIKALLDAKRLFALTDKQLDLRCHFLDSKNPLWLSNPEIANLVRQSMRDFTNSRYVEHRYCMMPNHLHWLLTPLKRSESTMEKPLYWALSDIMQQFKGSTARKANEILQRKGSFWQDESFDHWVRDDAEHTRIISYIDNNPVKAGLCATSTDWQWSSASESPES